MNPFLPFAFCIPDGEARVFGDRCYLYGSRDEEGRMDYCSDRYHVFSAPLDDLDQWTDHGEALRSTGPDSPIGWSSADLYAPDVCEKDGRYYLYFCLSDGTEGVAVSDRPEGPFRDASQIFYPGEIRQGAPLCNIDPAVFVDDDGSVYYYWGQVHMQAARLMPNMREIEPDTYVESLIDESGFWFHEGASMRKIRGRYYLVYCSIVTGRANTLDYAIGDSPLGPFTYCGSIINNVSCDPQSWNIHGCIQQVGEDYYVFYHRSSNCSFYSRRACAERIEFDEDGKIIPVSMSTMGFSRSIPASRIMPAIGACERTGACYFTGRAGTPVLTNVHTANRVGYRYLDFSGGSCRFRVRLRGLGRGILNLRIDSPTAVPLTSLSFGETRGFTLLEAPVEVPEGRHSVYLDFHGDGAGEALCELESFCFGPAEK